jgi:hypothetical protein
LKKGKTTMKCGLFTASLLGVCLSVGSSVGQEPDLSLGTKEWPAITNGVVFFNGEYIPPPYTVSRVENVVIINGRRIESGMAWPPQQPAPPPVIPQNEPIMPSTITEKTTIYDEDYLRFLTEARLYYFDKYGQEKGMDKIAEAFNKMPFVSSARRDPESPTGIILILKTGERSSGNLVPPSRKPNNMTKEQALKMMDRLCESYVSGLEGNHFFMLGNTYLRGTPDGYKMLLAPLSEAMKQATNEAHFASLFKTNQFSSSFSEKALRSFYQHKGDLPKWEPHVRETVEKEMR